VDLVKPTEGGSDICEKLTLLSALRPSDEAPPSVSRSTSVGHGKPGRDRHHGKRKLTDTTMEDRDSLGVESPGGPSPKVMISSQKDRLNIKTGGSRAGSVPAAREASALLEDDKDDQGKGKKKRSSVSSSLKKGAMR
jgi:SAGA-associated factor 29